MFDQLARLYGMPDYLDYLNTRLKRMEKKMSRLEDALTTLEPIFTGLAGERDLARSEAQEWKDKYADAIADDEQDTADIERLIAEKEAAADRIQALIDSAQPEPETPTEPEAPVEEAPAEEPAS